MAPEIWTAKEIAEWLRLSARHVAERIARSEDFPRPVFGHQKFGRKRWRKDDIIRWLESQSAH